tara:strand:- start:588 stop:839 length:252 start_codon:yes stop_codon:yes gene_type:complete
MHLHGTYAVDFDLEAPLIVFVLDEESVFRMYIAPHELEINMALLSNHQAEEVVTSFGQETDERMLYATLPKVRLFSNGIHSFS